MRKSHLKIKPQIKAAITLTLIAVLAFAFNLYGTLNRGKAPYTFYVKRVVDGDTIVLANNERVRYIGINTPETKHPKKPVEWMGKEASEFNRKLVEHKFASLEFDVEVRDKYGRLLAYVYVGDTFVNAELLKEGYAQVFTVPPNVKYVDFFLELQKYARDNKKGLWSKE